jgi:ferredoxin-NADP reductase
VEDAKNKRIYVSGPEPMVETLEKELLEAGLDKNNLVFDYFPGYQPI